MRTRPVFAAVLLSLVAAAPALAQVPVVPLCIEAGNDDKCEAWAARLDGSGHANDIANAVAVDPAGERVFVTGQSFSSEGGFNVTTVAYDAASGGQSWTVDEVRPGTEEGRTIAVSPDGALVLVGGSGGPAGVFVSAYDTATGSPRWDFVHQTGRSDRIEGLVLSADGKTAFVTGYGSHQTVPQLGIEDYDYVTIAIDVDSGTKLWSAQYQGAAQFWDTSVGIAAGVVPGSDPAVEVVAVTGRSNVAGQGNGQTDMVTVAYDAATGEQLWENAYDGPTNDREHPFALDIFDGTVFVTGESLGLGEDYATVAYDLASGEEKWAARRAVAGSDRPLALLASNDAVYVTGHADCCLPERILTVDAYDPDTGELLWEVQRSGPTGEVGHELALSPDGDSLYVGGMRGGHVVGAGFNVAQAGLNISPSAGYARFLLLALDATTGDQQWAAQYEGGTFTQDIALSTDGTQIFITGGGQSSLSGDYTTAAYSL